MNSGFTYSSASRNAQQRWGIDILEDFRMGNSRWGNHDAGNNWRSQWTLYRQQCRRRKWAKCISVDERKERKSKLKVAGTKCWSIIQTGLWSSFSEWFINIFKTSGTLENEFAVVCWISLTFKTAGVQFRTWRFKGGIYLSVIKCKCSRRNFLTCLTQCKQETWATFMEIIIVCRSTRSKISCVEHTDSAR